MAPLIVDASDLAVGTPGSLRPVVSLVPGVLSAGSQGPIGVEVVAASPSWVMTLGVCHMAWWCTVSTLVFPGALP
jgi:hypothetical protein